VLAGGTGKFAGITDEYDHTTTRPLEARGDVTRAGFPAKRLAGLVPRD